MEERAPETHGFEAIFGWIQNSPGAPFEEIQAFAIGG
jgi:hypothetical protein